MPEQGRSFPVEGEIHIGIVVGEHDVVAQGTLHERIEPVLGTGGGGGVVGKAEHHELQGIPGAGAELLGIGAPVVLRIQPEKMGRAEARSRPPLWEG